MPRNSRWHDFFRRADLDRLLEQSVWSSPTLAWIWGTNGIVFARLPVSFACEYSRSSEPDPAGQPEWFYCELKEKDVLLAGGPILIDPMVADSVMVSWEP